MASIGPVTLTAEPVPNSLNARVKVRYTVSFSSAEVAGNQPFREVVQLFGVDDGFLNQQDEPIANGRLRDVTLRPNGQASLTRDTEPPVFLQRRLLNEDQPGLDEILARVTLTAIGSTSRDSNTVRRDFNPANA